MTTRHPGNKGIPAPILFILALCSGYAPFAIDTYLVGLPQIAQDLNTSASLTQFTLTGFLLALAVGQLIIGPLSDRFGRRTLLLVGLAGAALASILCALAPSIWVLIAGRVLQGFFGAAGVVLGRAIVGDMGRGIGIARAFALLMSIQGIAPLVAPIVGGLLISAWSWRAVFWFLAGLGTATFIAVITLVPETLPHEERSQAGLRGSGRDIATLVRSRAYVAPLAVFVASFSLMFAYIAASPFALQNIGGLSHFAYSAVFTFNSLLLLIMNLVSRNLVGRTEPANLVKAGALCSIIAVAWLAIAVFAFDTAPWAIVPGFALIVIGAGLALPNSSAMAIEASGQRRGTGSALLGAGQFGLAAVAAPLTGIGNGETAIPMLVVMAAALAVQQGFLFILLGRFRG